MTMHLAFNLRYQGLYNLDRIEREGIGVYIINLTKAIASLCSNIKISFLIESSFYQNAVKAIEASDIKSLVQLIDETNISNFSDSVLNCVYVHAERYQTPIVNSLSAPVISLEAYAKFKTWLILQELARTRIHIRFLLRYDSLPGLSLIERKAIVKLVAVTGGSEEIIYQALINVSNTSRDQDLYIDINSIDIYAADSISIQIENASSAGYLFLTYLSISLVGDEYTYIEELGKVLSFNCLVSNSDLDVICFHHPLTYNLFTYKPSVYHIHDLLFLEHSSLFAHLGARALQENISSCVKSIRSINPNSHLIFSSDHVKDVHIKINFPVVLKKWTSTVIPNTTLDELEREFIEDTIGKANPSSQAITSYLSGNPAYIIYPTQPRATKQLPLLIDLTKELRREYPSLRLVMTCTSQDFERMLGRSSPDFIDFFSDNSRRDLFLLYNRALLTPVTTIYEASLPWQFLESFMCGTPSIIFNSAIVREFCAKSYIDQAIVDLCVFNSIHDAVEKSIYLINNKRKDFLVDPSSSPGNIVKLLKKNLPLTTWREVAARYVSVLDSACRCPISLLA